MRRFSPEFRSNLLVVGVLVVLTAASLLAEWRGLLTRHSFRLTGDFRRESHLFTQYGQGASALIIALLIWTLDPPRRRMIVPLLATILTTALLATALKHAIGRSRPAVGDAAEFRGLAADSSSASESFPSGHSAAAVATTVVLAALYPRARAVFWGLALTCATLRYVDNAHWPSDVFAGVTLGFVTGNVMWHWLVGDGERDRSPPPKASRFLTARA